MTSIAERLAPRLPGLVHPGDADTAPFPLMLAQFQTAQLPEGMAQEIADEMGMPTSDIGLHFLEALFFAMEQEGLQVIDGAELADLRAAAAANETKRNAIKVFCCETCDKALFRVMVKGFDTNRPTVPAAVKAHECRKP